MGLDISLRKRVLADVYSTSITHNLGKMANEAGIYLMLWHPGENGYETAAQMVDELEAAIKDMKSRPDHYRRFDAPNGWGTYDTFLTWLENLLAACRENPDAEIRADI